MHFSNLWAPLAEVQRAWDDAQPLLRLDYFRTVSCEHLGRGRPLVLIGDRRDADGEQLLHDHVVAAAAAMGFTRPRPTVDGLNERADGRLRVEELFADHVELHYPDRGGCELAAAIRDPHLRGSPSLLERDPNPRWLDSLFELLRSRGGTLAAAPTVDVAPYFHISWRQWLLLPQRPLVQRGVPSVEVAALRRAHTGHDNNMRLPAARTIGWWGGIAAEREIAEWTGQKPWTVSSYKKKDEQNRIGGKCALKTFTGGTRRTQAELAFMVGDHLVDRSIHDVCVELGILRIEYMLYQRLWWQVLLRTQADDMSSPQLRLKAAVRVMHAGGLRVGLPLEWWDLPPDARPREDRTPPREDRDPSALVLPNQSSVETDEMPAATEYEGDGAVEPPRCLFCKKTPAKKRGGYDEYTCQKCYLANYSR